MRRFSEREKQEVFPAARTTDLLFAGYFLTDLREGPAFESLARLRSQRVVPFDLVFIDADKPNNLAYVQVALELAREGTLIVVDNVVRDGGVVARRRDAAAEGVRRMTEWVAREVRLTATVIQTVGNKGYDEFLLARVSAPQ